MSIRLNKVTRDFNVGIATVVEFLQKKGFPVEENPNTKITEEQYQVLKKEFNKDKDLKVESERLILQRQKKYRNKASAISDEQNEKNAHQKNEDVVEVEIPDEVRPKFKPIGKIDLDNLSGGIVKAGQKKDATVKDINKEKEEISIVQSVKDEKKIQIEQQEPIAQEPKTIKVVVENSTNAEMRSKQQGNELPVKIIDEKHQKDKSEGKRDNRKLEEKVVEKNLESANFKEVAVAEKEQNENQPSEDKDPKYPSAVKYSEEKEVKIVKKTIEDQGNEAQQKENGKTLKVKNKSISSEKVSLEDNSKLSLPHQENDNRVLDSKSPVEQIKDKSEIEDKKNRNSSEDESQSQKHIAEKDTLSVVSSDQTVKESDSRDKENDSASASNPSDDKIFTLRMPKSPQINIIGQIDLAALNQSTRPKKKTKEEKRHERIEKDKLRQDQRKLMKEALIKEIRKDDDNKATATGKPSDAVNGKKKRTRINKEKVDVSKEVSNISSAKPKDHYPRSGNVPRPNNSSVHTNNSSNNNYKKGRFNKPVLKAPVNEIDVAKQVKETLARLTSKSKTKTSRYRRDKRDEVSSRLIEEENKEKVASKVLKLTEFVTASELASMMDIPVNKVISTCMNIGVMVSINQRLDAEAINLVAEEFGYKTEYVSADVSQAIVEEKDEEKNLVHRAPIVTVMGHVDHGKTSLLDYIRKANVIAGEAGGITQHIGAYNVTLEDGRRITFLDTPGHEAFTAMRARGAKATDVAIIIIAADDDIMPQTKEAINHAMAAEVPIVFAINKIDKPGANPDKIKEELANMNFLIEEWGGKYQSQDISAKKGTGVKELLEKVLLEAEMLDLKANPNRHAAGSVIESTLDKGRGYIATILIANGTLKVGDVLLAGVNFGRVKAMFNERNQRIKEAGPSEPVLILGLDGAPQAGDTFHVFDSEQEAREIANKRQQLQREQGLRTQKLLTLDEVGRRIALGNFQELNIIVKGDVDGSIEALSDSLIKLSTPQLQVNVIHQAVGQISESDVTLAAASEAIIIGFQVRPSSAARKYAQQEGVDVRLYSIIYDAIEEVKQAMEGMLAPVVKEEVTATIEVREVFHISKVGIVAGAMVKEGKAFRSDKARLIRNGIVIYTGGISALKRFKDDVKEVATNFECGISLVNCNDIQVGDIIESFKEVEVKQKL
ncbi:MAG: translation initiation factor IF-2 [Bacteroidaceae bacterium]|nr:translation initiation factor IF-2 [Bacteroidaceae bacterium]